MVAQLLEFIPWLTRNMFLAIQNRARVEAWQLVSEDENIKKRWIVVALAIPNTKALEAASISRQQS